MSTTIDSRVLEMRFDNQHFEKNVQTSMSTLDKLKQSLNLTGASKGLESVNAAAKNNNMGVLGSSVEAVSAKFSALQVMGVTALANITNSAVNTGKRMIKALTIDPIKTGLQEYETQINAVQTILANTSSKGTTIDQVNTALEELNKYADMTIYNFTEMTRNIGTFTAAGVDLDTSVSAIKGIANLAAVSGSTSQQASTAMYQLSQALATGTVKLQDWNSVVNAGMGGEVFQNALIRTAAAMSGAANDVEGWKAANIDAFGSFRDSLTQGAWLTTDVLTQTLNQFTMAAEEGSKEWEEYKKSLMETGYTEAQAEEILKMANTATDAATKVKTFTQLWDVLKESVQSGWAQTWKLIIGDFEEAKSLLTPLADFLTGAINKFSEARNKLLEGALGRNFKTLTEKVKGMVKPIEKSAEAVKNVVDKVQDYSKVVDEIIGGKWGNGEERWQSLTKAGYDWAHAQNLVNEKLGDGTRHATKYTEAQDKLAESQDKTANAQKNTAKEQAKQIAQLAEMDDAQLRRIGFTNSEIQSLRALEEQANKTGIPLQDFIENIDQIDGRYLLFNSFKNVGMSLVTVFKSMGEAWRDAFPPMTADQLYNIIAGMHKLSTYFTISEETADKLTRTFKGLFAILDIITTITSGGLKVGLKLLGKLLGMADLDLLSFTANLGDAVVKFRDFLFNNELITGALEMVSKGLISAGKAIAEMVRSFINAPIIQETIDKIAKAIENLKNVDLSSIGKDILAGLKNGLGAGIGGIINSMIDIGQKIISAIKGVLGIHSPSTVMYEIGTNVVDGLTNGLQNGIGKVVTFMNKIANKIVETVKNIDWHTVFAGAVSVGMVATLKRLLDIFDKFASPFGGLGDILGETAEVIHKSGKKIKKVIGGVANVLNSFAMTLKAKAIKDVAISIAILAASIALLSFLDAGSLWKAVGVIAALAVILGVLGIAISKMSDSAVSITKGGVKIGGMKTALIAIGLSLLLLATTVKTIGNMDIKSGIKGFIGLAGLVAALTSVIIAFGLIAQVPGAASNISRVGGMMLKMSVALLIMVGVIKLISMLEWRDMGKAAVGLLGFVAFVQLLSVAAAIGGDNVSKLGGMMLKMAIALGIMVGVVKLISMLSWEEMGRAAVGIAGFVAFVGALVAVTSHGGDKELYKVSGLLMAVSTSMLIMVGIIKLISMMSWDELGKGAAGIVGLTIIIGALVGIAKSAGNDLPKVAITLLAMSVAIGILAGISVMLSLMSLGGLMKGIAAVGALAVLLRMLIIATKDAQDVKGSIIAMAVAIGVMAAAVAALSLIDATKLAKSTAALGVLMYTFSLMAKQASGLQKTMGPLIVLTVVVGLLAYVIYKLSSLPVEGALGASASLSMLLVAMSVAMAAMGRISKVSPMALVAAGVMLLVVGALAGILYLLQDLPIESTLANTVALSALLLALSAACIILNGASAVSPIALATIGVMTLVVAALAGILYLIQDLPIESTLANTAALSTLLLALSGACVILGIAGTMGPAALIGVGSLMALVVGIGALIVGIGALVDKFPKLEEFLNKGLPILEKIGYGLGSFFGNIVGGFMEGATSGLPEMANSLSEFMTNIQPFIEGAKSIDETAMTGVSSLVKMIALVSGANILESVTSFITGSSSMETFAAQLNKFADAIVSFSNKVKGNIDEESVLAAANAGKLLAEMQTMVSGTGGVLQFFAGEKNLDAFASQITNFAGAIVSFSNSVSGKINEEAVTAAANAGRLLTEMQASIVPSGGVFQFFTGEKDMAVFGSQLVSFGRAIVQFSNSVSAGINEEAVTAAANAGKIMAELQASIPGSNGVFQIFTGQQDLATFGIQLVAFGKAITEFSNTVASGVNEEAVVAAANAGKVMASLQNSIPEDKWLDGKVSIDDFGGKITKFGEKIKQFSEEVSGIDSEGMTTAASAARQIINIAKSLADFDSSGMDSFKPKSLGTSIKGYADAVSGIDSGSISSSISAINKLKTTISSLAGLDTSGVASFKSAVSSLANTDLSGVASAFSKSAGSFSKVGTSLVDSIAKGMKSKSSGLTSAAKSIVSNVQKAIASQANVFQKAGSDAITKFASGMTKQKNAVTAAAKASVASAATGLKASYSSFFSAGSYLVTGFVNGIKFNAFKAAIAARAMANAAEQAAKAALDINSPSKVFRKIGAGIPEGFAQGISMLSSYVTGSTTDMARNAIDNTKLAMSRVTDLLNTDLDSEFTIRPVVDLSDVRAGAKSINGLFSMQPSVGVMSNIGAITSMMNSRNQNGIGDEVVSAIDKLRKDLGNIGGGTSYTINGITYDDGSNVSSAVQSLIRAAMIERRI